MSLRFTEEQYTSYLSNKNLPQIKKSIAEKRQKYNAKKVFADGMWFDSKWEHEFYQQLKLRQKAGEILYFLRRVPIHLPGGVTLRVDFVIFYADGRVEYVDTKGVLTRTFIDKKKMVEALYPITINVVKKV